MKSNNELKETDIKNRACHYSEDIIIGTNIIFSNILLDKKNYMKIFQFITSCIKLQQVENHCALGSIK